MSNIELEESESGDGSEDANGITSDDDETSGAERERRQAFTTGV